MLRFQVLLVVLCSSELLVKADGAPQGEQLTELLQEDLSEVPTHLLLLRLVSQLTASGGTVMLRQLEDEELGQERLLRRQIRFSHRERKAGCRNFFWKTFTSC
ncbi:somatostatin-1 [Nothobranchius furzeri]|uniref:somatostatin-1 n=1 Tax=Nothobranchius furzeri TaxID=105023 RepID=UPI002403F58C|nr:somatostatin-1 [Nothobranchius furzeri]